MKARFLVVLCLLAGCSVYMEATRPTPVDLSKFHPGDERDSVLEQLGVPDSTEVQPGGESCDLYRLYTTGHGTVRKVATMVGEGATDVVMPLAELLWTPAQALTKDEKHPIWFCYKNKKLISVGTKPSPTATPTATSTSITVTTTPTVAPTPAAAEGVQE